jgi:DNA-binding response OmpR family regulator
MGAPTVLLVEDEPEIVGLLTDFLAVEGYGVVAAGDAAGATPSSTATASTACCST